MGGPGPTPVAESGTGTGAGNRQRLSPVGSGTSLSPGDFDTKRRLSAPNSMQAQVELHFSTIAQVNTGILVGITYQHENRSTHKRTVLSTN